MSKKIKTKIEWEFHPDDMPEIPVDIFVAVKPKINNNIKKINFIKRTKDGSTGKNNRLF